MNTPKQPNVMLISVDDMNDWVACLDGYPGVRTPNIDRLAQRGALFTNAQCPSPLCNPSRTAIMLGKMPSSTGIYENSHWWRPAHPEALTIPGHFMADGYMTAGGGKVFHHTAGFNPPDQWHTYHQLEFDDPWDRPPEAYPWMSRPSPPPQHPLNGLTPFAHEFDWGVLNKSDGEYADVRTVDWVESFLQCEHTSPFFLATGTFRPHLPWYAPQTYFDQYPMESVTLPPMMDNDLEDLPPVAQELAARGRDALNRVRDVGKWNEAVQGYLASISFADALIGRLISALDRSRYADSTVIVFYSDNGFHVGEKEHWYKSTLWERATHVPFIVVVPGLTHPGSVCQRPVNLIDIYPTLVELCNLSSRDDLDGQSLIPLLAEPNREWNRPSVTTFLRGNHAARSERWRYVRYSDGGEELYDHESDPNEFHNLSDFAEYRGIKEELAQCFPEKNALDAPTKKDYDFNHDNYTWKRKTAGA